MKTWRTAGRIKMETVAVLGCSRNYPSVQSWNLKPVWAFQIRFLRRFVRCCNMAETSACLSQTVRCCKIVCEYSARSQECSGGFMINTLILAALQAAVPLARGFVSAHDSLHFLSFFFLSFSVSLFLTLSLWPLLFLFPLSHYSMSLPSSLSVFTPPFSWQRCQSGLADRGKHSTGQSIGRSKGWRIDYVCVCVLMCPLSAWLHVSPCFGHM